MKGYKAIFKQFEVQESTSEKHLTIANNYYSFEERTSHIIHLRDRAYGFQRNCKKDKTHEKKVDMLGKKQKSL